MASITSPSTRTNAFAKFMIEIGRELFGSYRPEKHYMRGSAAKRGQFTEKASTDHVHDDNPHPG